MPRRRQLVPLALVLTLCSMAACDADGGDSAGPTPPTSAPTFEAVTSKITDYAATSMMGVSWHEECPVPIGDLRSVQLSYWGFDDKTHSGRLIVHKDVAEDVATIFRALYNERFPVHSMQPVRQFGGDDNQSMAANNTSAFNCREITGASDTFSVHSYGKAIDINPIQNPYVNDETVLPPEGMEYLDRADARPGMIADGDVVTKAFANAGFTWGGDWNSLKDYQHFEVAQ